MQEIVKINNLSKKYRKNSFYSLKDVNVTINDGDIIGLIGKNGAGKSTFLKLITKAINPTTGSIEYKGQNIHQADNVLEPFGIMIETVFLPYLSVIDNLNFYLEIHNKTEYKDNIKNTLNLVGLWAHRNRKPADFSFGMKQRVALAIALVTEPSFLILDEPFVGLDPVGVSNLIDILKQWASKRQVTMIISSHQLEELESLCTRYIFIDQGQLRKAFNKNVALMEIQTTKLSDDLIKTLKQYGQTVEYNAQNNKIVISKDISQKDLNNLLLILTQAQVINSISNNNSQLKGFFDTEKG